MKNKRVIHVSSGIAFLMIISMFFYLSTFVQPKIVFTAEVNKITDEDYERIMDSTEVFSSGKGIGKFRHINIHIKAMAPLAIINNINIEKYPSQQYFLQLYLKDNPDIQILGGGNFVAGSRIVAMSFCEPRSW